MSRKNRVTLNPPAANKDVILATALDKAFKGFDFTTPPYYKKSGLGVGGYTPQHKGHQRIDTKIRILAKQILINQWFTAFNLLVSILLTLKFYGFGG